MMTEAVPTTLSTTPALPPMPTFDAVSPRSNVSGRRTPMPASATVSATRKFRRRQAEDPGGVLDEIEQYRAKAAGVAG